MGFFISETDFAAVMKRNLSRAGWIACPAAMVSCHEHFYETTRKAFALSQTIRYETVWTVLNQYKLMT